MLYLRYTDPPSHIVGEETKTCPALVDEGREAVDELTYSRMSEAEKLVTPVTISRPVHKRLSEAEAVAMRPAGVIDLALCGTRSAGDVVAMTAVVRALHRAHPGKYRTVVQTWFPELWENNPYLTPESQIVQPMRVDWDWRGGESKDQHTSFVQFWRNDLSRQLGVPIPMPDERGDVYMKLSERDWPADLLGEQVRPIALVNAGTKDDSPTKQWGKEHYQAVVDHFKDRIEFVQIGAKEHRHEPLTGVTNLVGKTGIRDLVRLLYQAKFVVCPITFIMHLSAAVPTPDHLIRPCFVLAGGRESTWLTQYDGHIQFNTIGRLKCCATGACGRHKFPPSEVHDDYICLKPVRLGGGETVGECMRLIPPTQVIASIESTF